MDREKGVFYPPNIDIDEVDLGTPLSKFGDLTIINDCTFSSSWRKILWRT